ncbi:hypothetical protein CPB84DRAFT_374057 [Gymnopilus junonius]|uniref:Uncharacterized protein n=1 Tax=Gymnopilus junonius TaxID=109634 RepID=A0A9P5TG78_GYMJU|nr:hypothetical protein CPB84DRAFT_374057 [Gymnopilus junonius]
MIFSASNFPTNTRAPGEDDAIISSFATLFSSCDFAAVTTLNLDMHRGLGPSSSTDAPGVLLSPSYLPYFSSFPSITYLSVHESALRIILALSEPIIDSQNHLFPLLETLTIHAFEDNLAVSTSSGSGSGSGSIASRPLVPFLLHRKSIGLPVRTLVYYVSRYYQPVIRGLEDMIGLRVCRRGPGSEELEYVCGQA